MADFTSLTGAGVNIRVATSNIFGFLLFLQPHPLWVNCVSVLMIAASVLMHLSERKHDLPGISPFHFWASKFLWFDRIMCYICFGITLHAMYQYWWLPQTNPNDPRMSTALILYGLFGLVLNLVSEIATSRNFPTIPQTNLWYVFMITHGIWHFIAYSFFATIINVYI